MTGRTLRLTGLSDAPAVAEQPRVSLQQWRVMRLATAGDVLVGLQDGGLATRVSTDLISVRAGQREVTTESGRVYELSGPPASNPDMLVLLAARVVVSSGPVVEDVTTQYWALIEAAAP
jgi:hypothetical protein